MFEPAHILLSAATLCIGLAIGWYLWGVKARRSQDLLRETEDELYGARRRMTQAEAQRADEKAELEARGARVAELEAELKAQRAKASDPETLANLRRDLDQARRQLEKSKGEVEAAEKLLGEIPFGV
ncbi:MAG TPA: hypothetical protein PK095_00665, partial [Myxococcota bacterium]|nr:hypothetical protein [Myxococcota bacterium]